MKFILFVKRYGDKRDLHSFPTRRSSDLPGTARTKRGGGSCRGSSPARCACSSGGPFPSSPGRGVHLLDRVEASARARRRRGRSEEHTSELQSRQYLVCRLLLEKK